MGHRLSKIYTRTGDDGTTGLGDGARVTKDDACIEALGTVDELNSLIGVLLCEVTTGPLMQTLTEIQHALFDLGGELSLPNHSAIKEQHVTDLEQALDALNADLSPLKEFILPGGARAAAVCHLARAVCRRAERRVASLSRARDLSPSVLRYLNRLSDLLFVMARSLNRAQGKPDVLWRPDRRST